MRRTLLFAATNLAVLTLLSVVLNLLGVDQWLYREGFGLNLHALLVFSAIFGMGGAFVSLALSKWMARTAMGVKVIERPATYQQQWLVATVASLSRKAGIGTPEVGIFQSDAPNAFASGMSRDDALVAVSSGLLARMQLSEIEAVLGHEITHIANGDMVTMGLLQGVINTFVIFLARVVGYVVDRSLFGDERGMGMGYFLTTIVAQIFLSLFATLIVMAFSRWREYRADAGGARLAGRSNMIAALRRLQAVHGARDLPGNLAAFGISGRSDGALARLFMSHPPLAERISALERSASGPRGAARVRG
ncbi:MAG: protease HtpX [Gammaproteobacteria bacterium]|jgi:heat shock protein HtpX